MGELATHSMRQAMRPSLAISLVNLLVFAGAGVVLYMKLLNDPWDLLAFGVFALLCPIAGTWLALSHAFREMRREGRGWQSLVASVLSVVLVGLAVLTIASRK